MDFFQKIDGCRVIEIHTDISSRISSFFSSTGMINGIGRKRERERIRIRKKFITRRNLVKAFLFLFFFTRILDERRHAGILDNILQNEFFFPSLLRVIDYDL